MKKKKKLFKNDAHLQLGRDTKTGWKKMAVRASAVKSHLPDGSAVPHQQAGFVLGCLLVHTNMRLTGWL